MDDAPGAAKLAEVAHVPTVQAGGPTTHIAHSLSAAELVAQNGAPDELPIERLYEHNPKHGARARTGPGGVEISRAPLGDCQAILDCSVPNGPRHRTGIDGSSRTTSRELGTLRFAADMDGLYPGIVDGVAPGPRGGFPREAPTDHLTWHHEATSPGTMQLVPRDQHMAPGPVQQSLHPDGRGGMAIWGGGR